MTDSPAARVLGLTTIGAATATFRYLTLAGFSNDHYVHLTPARQWLLGDWPTRDFVDPGMPLMYGASALAQVLLGPSLMAEGVLVAAMFGLGAVLAFMAVRRLTGSPLLALFAVVVAVAIFPRTYSYPKLVLYAAGLLTYARYVERPTRGRLTVIAVLVAVAFLARHDHGLFLGIGGVVAAMCTEGPMRLRVQRALALGGLSATFLTPYVAYVQATLGLGAYLATALEFSGREAARAGFVWPTPALGAAPAVLLTLTLALPVAALVVAWVRRRTWPLDAPIVPAIAVGLVVNPSFLRDPIESRLPDAVVPATVIGAWLIHRAWTSGSHRSAARAVAGAVAVVGVWTTLEIGRTADEINRLGLSRPWQVLERVRERTTELRTRFAPRQMPTRLVQGLTPVFAYLDRCTTSTDRVLTAGFMPEVPYYARRGFAGGQLVFMYGYYASETSQQRVVSRLRRQRVPIALVPSDYAADLAEDFRVVSAHVRGRYRTLAAVPIDDEVSVEVLVDDKLAPSARDIVTGWPCFR